MKLYKRIEPRVGGRRYSNGKYIVDLYMDAEGNYNIRAVNFTEHDEFGNVLGQPLHAFYGSSWGIVAWTYLKHIKEYYPNPAGKHSLDGWYLVYDKKPHFDYGRLADNENL